MVFKTCPVKFNCEKHWECVLFFARDSLIKGVHMKALILY